MALDAELDLQELIEEAAATASRLLREKRVAARSSCRRHAPPVPADRDRLMQVMLNLMSNAVKFCDRDGRVASRSRCSAAADALQVDVQRQRRRHRARRTTS